MIARLQLLQKTSKWNKIIAIDLHKQQVLDADWKAIQQINFPGNLSHNNNRLTFFIIEEAKETVLDFSQGTVKVVWIKITIFFKRRVSIILWSFSIELILYNLVIFI